jgi:MoaA/NifB/PqqE/SkfB family radical SAM enzyme
MTTIVERFKRVVYKTPVFFDLAKRTYRSNLLNRQKLFQRWILAKAQKFDADPSPKKLSIIVETSLTCNARCKMCVHSERPMVGIMSKPLFEKIVRDILELGVEQIAMSGYGEPLMDPHWLERIRLLRANGLKYDFITNASLMTPWLADALFELGGWEGVNFSLNGLSREVYELIMPPLKRDKTYRNVEAFLETMQKRGLTKPRVTVSCIRLQDNQSEWKEFIAYWRGKPGVDRVVMGDFENWLDELKKDEELGAIKRGVANGVWKAPCPAAFRILYIRHDGLVMPCFAASANRQLALGNANESSLKEILQGRTATEFRTLHKQGRRCEHSLCSLCKLNYPWVW